MSQKVKVVPSPSLSVPQSEHEVVAQLRPLYCYLLKEHKRKRELFEDAETEFHIATHERDRALADLTAMRSLYSSFTDSDNVKDTESELWREIAASRDSASLPSGNG